MTDTAAVTDATARPNNLMLRLAVAALLVTSLVGIVLIFTLVWAQNQDVRQSREQAEGRARDQQQIVESQAAILETERQLIEHVRKVERACRIEGPFADPASRR